MKLLMVTRKLDYQDALAGFTWTLVKKLSENLDGLKVISWQAGDASGLNEKVGVFSLAKRSKLLKPFFLFFIAFRELKHVDGLFCHMNPEYTIIAGLAAKLRRKKIVSWYTHKQVNWKRRLLEIIADTIVTASPESFRSPWFPQKVKVLGHGIDVERFSPDNGYNQSSAWQLITVGRLSPTKDYESMIKAIDILSKDGIDVSLKIIGDAGLKNQLVYSQQLKAMVKSMSLIDRVVFLGAIANNQIREYLGQSDIFINLSNTGSVDKAVLEAMACGRFVLTSNEAFKKILPPELMVEKNNPAQLAAKVKWLMSLPEDKKAEIKNNLREEVVQNHNLDNLVQKIISQFQL